MSTRRGQIKAIVNTDDKIIVEFFFLFGKGTGAFCRWNAQGQFQGSIIHALSLCNEPTMIFMISMAETTPCIRNTCWLDWLIYAKKQTYSIFYTACIPLAYPFLVVISSSNYMHVKTPTYQIGPSIFSAFNIFFPSEMKQVAILIAMYGIPFIICLTFEGQ